MHFLTFKIRSFFSLNPNQTVIMMSCGEKDLLHQHLDLSISSYMEQQSFFYASY